MKRLVFAALLLATASSLSFAQSPKGSPGMGGPGMMGGQGGGQGMMGPGRGPGMMGGQGGGPGMMGGQGGGQGMMGGGMMNGMGGSMPMMGMMQGMGMMGSGAGGGMGMGLGMATIDRVEGRIAFLHAELKITDAQSTAWKAFADALRANAKSLGEVRASMSGMDAQQSLVERLALQEKWLAARLEGTRTIKTALTNLIGVLSDEQKKTADELLAPHMGMRAMMQPGQMGGSMMRQMR